LAALAEGGVAAVAVEPLAVQVGATKGSAYWHFPNREALLQATVERWERERTEAIIAFVEAEPDPLDRLRLLFRTVLERAGDSAVERALLAAADDPVVGPVLHRVIDRRVGYLVEMFGALGFDEEVAKARAVLAYSLYLGQAQLVATAPHLVTQRKALLEETLSTLTVR
jgi:AcrR family transcriptional regulator